MFPLLPLVGCTPAQNPPAPAPKGAIATVPIRDISAGERLTDDLLVRRDVPGNTASEALGGEELSGRVASRRLLAWEPVRTERLAPVETGAGLQAVVSKGSRATPVKVRSVVGVEPGAWVDLAEAGADGGPARLLGWSSQVLAVDGPSHQLVLATSLAQAQALGRPVPRTAVFRSPVDATNVEANAYEGPSPAPPPGPTVAVARHDLAPGIGIVADDLDSVATDGSGLGLDASLVAGRIPREPILAGEVVRPERLAEPWAGTGIHAVVPRGMVGVAIPADGTGPWLAPGSYVDLIASSPADHTTTVPLQAMFVLRVGAGEVALLATSSQAVELAGFLDAGGSLNLVARNDLDIGFEKTAPLPWGGGPG